MRAASPLYELCLERGTGRSFTVSSLGWVVARSLAKPPKRGYDGSGFDRDFGAYAPIFLALDAPSTSLDPFLRNFRDGADASTPLGEVYPGYRLRLDPRAPLRERRVEHRGRSLFLAWHPAFEIKPEKANDQSVEFISMPRRRWLHQQTAGLGHVEDPLLATRAGHVCAFLARRTSVPLLPDASFHLRLFESIPDDWRGHVDKVGLEDYVDPVLVRAPRRELREWLRRQTVRYMERDAA